MTNLSYFQSLRGFLGEGGGWFLCGLSGFVFDHEVFLNAVSVNVVGKMVLEIVKHYLSTKALKDLCICLFMNGSA